MKFCLIIALVFLSCTEVLAQDQKNPPQKDQQGLPTRKRIVEIPKSINNQRLVFLDPVPLQVIQCLNGIGCYVEKSFLNLSEDIKQKIMSQSDVAGLETNYLNRGYPMLWLTKSERRLVTRTRLSLAEPVRVRVGFVTKPK